VAERVFDEYDMGGCSLDVDDFDVDGADDDLPEAKI
jgi:hypothetical protein